MIAELEKECINLKHQIELEEWRERNFDPAHFAYPICAKVATDRCVRIAQSAESLRKELEKVRLEIIQAIESSGLGSNDGVIEVTKPAKAKREETDAHVENLLG